MSFIPRMPYYRWLDAILTFVTQVTDPILNLFRRFLPPVRLGPGALDLAPMVATFVLLIVAGIAADLIRG
ncbi:MAG: YggT family protein [Thermoleophilaceae bacterium]|nr:YggT family protein [Thermoleophilaceae bacterium]